MPCLNWPLPKDPRGSRGLSIQLSNDTAKNMQPALSSSGGSGSPLGSSGPRIMSGWAHQEHAAGIFPPGLFPARVGPETGDGQARRMRMRMRVGADGDSCGDERNSRSRKEYRASTTSPPASQGPPCLPSTDDLEAALTTWLPGVLTRPALRPLAGGRRCGCTAASARQEAGGGTAADEGGEDGHASDLPARPVVTPPVARARL